MAGGFDLPASSSKGGIQLVCLTPAHVVHESGKADRSSSGLKFMQDPDSSTLTLCSSTSLPGNGKKFTAKQLLERIPTAITYINGAKKCADVLQTAGHMSAQQRLLYDSVFMPRAQSLIDTCTLANPKDGLALALAIDQEVRFFQFDNGKSWDSDSGRIDDSIYQKGLAMLYSGVSPYSLGTNLTATVTTKNIAAAPVAPPAGPAPGAPRTYPGLSYKELLPSVPQAFRATCCMAFYQTGRCRRPGCTYAATGHKCFLCQSTNHGTAQCPGQPTAPAAGARAGPQ